MPKKTVPVHISQDILDHAFHVVSTIEEVDPVKIAIEWVVKPGTLVMVGNTTICLRSEDRSQEQVLKMNNTLSTYIVMLDGALELGAISAMILPLTVYLEIEDIFLP